MSATAKEQGEVTRWAQVSTVAFTLVIGCGGKVGASYGDALDNSGKSSTGGATWCESDADCTECPYDTAPQNATQCETGFHSCVGVFINDSTCEFNTMAWQLQCPPQTTGCVKTLPGLRTLIACTDGACVGSHVVE